MPLSDQVLTLTTSYLGPASKLFLERQTKMHMNGLELANIKKEHLPELAKWVYVSASLLISKERAHELSEKMKRLN